MPTYGNNRRDMSDVWRKAERQVLEKFPAIVVGSSGWHRAVQNRFRRIR